MGWPQLALQIFLRFIFATPAADVIKIASAAIAVWTAVAGAYVYLKPDPYPLFFGVPARRAHWYTPQPFLWKWAAIPCLAGAVLLFAVWPARAHPVVHPVVQGNAPGDTLPGDDLGAAPADLDRHITPILIRISQFQTAYYDQHGRFAQVLPLFANAPSEGIAALPDRLTDIPTSGVRGSDLWAFVNLAAFPANIRIDVYDGPQGKGFVVTLEARFNNQLYTTSINSGPEGYRANGWVVVSESEQ
jgi:hypothetical protein